MYFRLQKQCPAQFHVLYQDKCKYKTENLYNL